MYRLYSRRLHRVFIELDKRATVYQGLALGGQETVHSQIVLCLPGSIEGQANPFSATWNWGVSRLWGNCR